MTKRLSLVMVFMNSAISGHAVKKIVLSGQGPTHKPMLTKGRGWGMIFQYGGVSKHPQISAGL